ncbi:MAG: PadR family transcriptional regulator [Ruminiclostridium sp.]|nr:PadR family transcriptional regulator [Ruminiclostridium sp.]
MISSDIIRGYTDTMILFIMSRGDSYGYEISKQIKEISEGNYVMKETTLYSALTRLEKNGFIASYSGLHDGRKRTYYKITEAGTAYYNEKCSEWELTKKVIDNFIETQQEE